VARTVGLERFTLDELQRLQAMRAGERVPAPKKETFPAKVPAPRQPSRSEQWREIVGEYHRAAAQAIERFGVSVAQYLGDGVMAYFGWAQAPPHLVRNGGDCCATFLVLQGVGEYDYVPLVQVFPLLLTTGSGSLTANGGKSDAPRRVVTRGVGRRG